MPAVARREQRRVGRPPNPPDPRIAQRVRSLRQAAGLTQAELAGSELSKGFISLVETTRTALSLRAARILAPRLGVSAEDLLRPGQSASQRGQELELTRAEAELASGDPAKAIATLEGAGRVQPDLRSRAARVRGRALLATDSPREAVVAFDEALRLYRQRGDREMVARTLFDLATAYARCEAHGEAANYALQAESAINAGDVIDASLEMRVLSFLAGTFVTLGDATAADLRVERARKLADDIAEPRSVGNLYYNLAVVREREGDHEAALRFATKALAAYEQLGVQAHIGSVWNTLGWIHVRRGRFGQADEALQRAQRFAEATGDDRLAAYVLQSRAELELARGHAKEAVALAESSVAHAHASALGRASSLLVRAEALAKAGAPLPQVNEAYARALAALKPFGRELVARAHRSHFEALMARGRERDAARVAREAFSSRPAPAT